VRGLANGPGITAGQDGISLTAETKKKMKSSRLVVFDTIAAAVSRLSQQASIHPVSTATGEGVQLWMQLCSDYARAQ
jgi:hypothetical protein